ncbi:type II secretion system protein GspG [Candidatus Poribacteria bacterium]|nr:type II secretion system protein GspG [Candidatus Poribacteria bacterium]
MITRLLRRLARAGAAWRRENADRDEGFTLVEILVVLTIVGILAAGISPVVLKRIDQARQTKALMQVRTFEDALHRYAIDVGDYPSSEEGLESLVTQPDTADGWTGPYVRGMVTSDGVIDDPWGTPYVYIYPGDNADLGFEFDIVSYGKDGQEGGADNDADITNYAGVVDDGS